MKMKKVWCCGENNGSENSVEGLNTFIDRPKGLSFRYTGAEKLRLGNGAVGLRCRGFNC